MIYWIRQACIFWILFLTGIFVWGYLIHGYIFIVVELTIQMTVFLGGTKEGFYIFYKWGFVWGKIGQKNAI